MEIKNFKNRVYVKIKTHTFQVITGFKVYGDIAYMVINSQLKIGMIQEYLPEGWTFKRTKKDGQTIYTLWKKKYFNYKSKAQSPGAVLFVAPTKKGAFFLAAKWWCSFYGFAGDDQTVSNVANNKVWKYGIALSSDFSGRKDFHAVRFDRDFDRTDSVRKSLDKEGVK